MVWPHFPEPVWEFWWIIIIDITFFISQTESTVLLSEFLSKKNLNPITAKKYEEKYLCMIDI